MAPRARPRPATTAPTLAAVLAELHARGKPTAAATYRRHGVRGETVGLSYADLGALVKRLAPHPELAPGLWASGLHDARVLATRLADPAALGRPTLTRWLGECRDYLLTDAVSALAARSPEALLLARRWLASPREWVGAAGWNVVATLAVAGRLEERQGAALLPLIEARMPDAPNRTRHAMNGALIALGGSLPGLRAAALGVAGRVGRVEVDHGETGCRTPDAARYIARMAAHAARHAGTRRVSAKPGATPRPPARPPRTRRA